MRRVFTIAISALVLIALLAVPACTTENGVQEFNLTVQVSHEGSGITTPTGTTSVAAGTEVDIEATASHLWEFLYWEADTPDGAFTDENLPAAKYLMPNKDVVLTANFAMLRCTIIRDSFGVPHVYARTKADLAFGAGYAMAQDRLWQADVLRRTASGRLAEFLGPDQLPDDMKFRALWYNQEELLDIYDEWDPGEEYGHLKDMIEAYIEGINLYIDEALAAFYVGDWSLMPIEYVGSNLVQYLEPFTVADVVAVTVLMAWQFGGTGGNEGDFHGALMALIAEHPEAPPFPTAWDIFNDLFPLNDAGAPVTIPAEEGNGEALLGTLSYEFDDGLGELLSQYEESRAARDQALRALGIPDKFGSNAIPISGGISASGNTLQLGGPQMGYSVPQIVYEIGLHGDGINAVGMAFPGAGPFILIGVSEFGAWTSTTGASDVVDLRVLDVRLDGATLQYFYDGEWRDEGWLEVRTETFNVRGLPEPVVQTFYRSHYGPIVEVDLVGGKAITMHTPFFRNEIGAEQGWQLFQEATHIDEFETAVQMIWPSHNFVWSGVDGNIGYWHAGRFPVKPEGVDRRLPLKGDGTEEWNPAKPVTDPDEMPSSINPTQGWLANWNNKPIADWPYAESDFHWGEGHRVQILLAAMEMMAPDENLTTAHLNQLNKIGGYHHTAGISFVGTVAAAAMASGNTTLEAAGVHLLAWATQSEDNPLPVSYLDIAAPSWPADANPTYDHPGLTIFDAWYDRIVPKVFEDILPEDLIEEVKGRPSLLIRVLREDASLMYDGYPDETELNTMIVEALHEAVDYLTGEYGADMTTWLTPVRMQSYDQMGALPVVNPATGQPWHPRMNRGTYNHIAELRSGVGELPLGKSVIPPGQSGFMWLEIINNTPNYRPSVHAFDQVALYAGWAYKPMHLSLAAAEAAKTWQRDFPQ